MLHLVFNLLWWWYLGGQIEQRLGGGKLFILLIVGAALPNIAEFFASGPRFGGLSGWSMPCSATAGCRTRLQPDCGLAMPPALMGFMLVWLVLGFLDMLGTPPPTWPIWSACWSALPKLAGQAPQASLSRLS